MKFCLKFVKKVRLNIFHSAESARFGKGVTATVGTFDGVHLGHREILKAVANNAIDSNTESVLITFHPHPRMVLYPDDHNMRLLTSPEERISQIAATGIKNMIIIPFTKEFSRLTSLDFVRDILVNQLNLKKLVIGYDHHFGRNREGSIENLTDYAALYQFDLEQIPAFEMDGIAISSSKIRALLENGNVATASKYLGYSYSLQAKVVEGKKLGSKMGFPTANLVLEFPPKSIPGRGVYIVRVLVHGRDYPGLINIGLNPTVSDDVNLKMEVYIHNFSGNIYGEVIEVAFVQRLRDELKFSSLDDLKNQLEIDRQHLERFLINAV
jgi:riboflavin kinase / FMN adenylyltransferase